MAARFKLISTYKSDYLTLYNGLYQISYNAQSNCALNGKKNMGILIVFSKILEKSERTIVCLITKCFVIKSSLIKCVVMHTNGCYFKIKSF